MSNTENKNGKWKRGAEKTADVADKTADVAGKVAAGAAGIAILIRTMLGSGKK